MNQSLEQAKSSLFSIARSFRDNHYDNDFDYQKFYAVNGYSEKIFTEFDNEFTKCKHLFVQAKTLTIIETIVFASRKLLKIIYPIEVEIPCIDHEDNEDEPCFYCEDEIEYEYKLVYKIMEVKEFNVLDLTIKEFMEKFKDVPYISGDIQNPYND